MPFIVELESLNAHCKYSTGWVSVSLLALLSVERKSDVDWTVIHSNLGGKNEKTVPPSSSSPPRLQIRELMMDFKKPT